MRTKAPCPAAGTPAGPDSPAARPASRPGAERAEEGALEALMQAAQDGDARAYDRLLRAIQPLLRGIARRRIADAAEAEDAVQDTLLTVHRLLQTYDSSRPIRPWLVAICERRCIDRLRRGAPRRLRETSLDPFRETLAAPSHQHQGLNEGEARVAAAQLRQAVAALPASQRTALCLAKLEDLPLAEAAAQSGLSVGALKVATHRALRTLRRRLAEAGPEDATPMPA